MLIKKADGRFWEIDLIRGVAIILMIFFHILYDLNHYSITKIRLYTGPISYIAYLSASIFIIIVGISLTISHSKSNINLLKNEMLKKFIKRGIIIFILGMIITGVSYIYIPERYVIFGILHFIGISIILSIPFIYYKKANLILGLLFIIIGIYLKTLKFDFNLLIPLGFVPNRFFTIDYFPIFPWFGVVLFGIAIGNYIYPNSKRIFSMIDYSYNPIIKALCFLGRHSLLIYFLHQPILIGLLFLLIL